MFWLFFLLYYLYILVLSFFFFLFSHPSRHLTYCHAFIHIIPKSNPSTSQIADVSNRFYLILPTLISVIFFFFYINIHLNTLILLQVNSVCWWRQLNKFSSKTFLSKHFVQELQQQWYLTSWICNNNMTSTVNSLVTINWLNLNQFSKQNWSKVYWPC